jgi:hypothetical protein
MVKPRPTKPNEPMRRAEDARILVGIGKPRTAYISPVACTHYQPLPAATTRPKQPKNLDSIHTDMKPMDYIGLYIIVIASCTVATNWLYRLYF